MTAADIEHIDAMVNDLGERIAREVKTEEELVVWLTQARDSLNTQIDQLRGR